MTRRSLTLVPAPAVTPGPGRRTRPVAESGPVVGSLCTGYGGLDLGVLAALGGGRIAWVADPDPHIAQILDARTPGIPNLGDLRHIDWTSIEPVDVLVAGFPCQDISAAGKRAGIEKGVRSGLWADIVAGLRVLRPALLIVENVAALRWRNGGLHRVLGDLAEAGYDALWRSVRAADVGAAHRRERVFLLAWLREPSPGRRDGDAADADCARRLVQWHQRRQQAGRSVTAGPASAVADSASLGHRYGGPQGRSGIPAATVTAGAPAGGPRGVPADATSDGRNEGLSGTAGLQGRPDAALGGHPPAHPAGAPPGRGQRDRRHLVAVPDAETSSASGVESAPVNWGVYEAAIRRWEAVLGRPTPHPTQPGNHGRPVLAPAFVEHLMGLTEGWVTDLSLPRTAQLRALGNGVVPQQAAYAVALLLADLAELLDINTDHRSPTGQEVTAA
ncbi:DNA cytosine methyltransferase [Alloactinosynnema sp. L-07]|uniref:DNA cytosine methyltransferase n=1 Tax=Alloactinosynnema sp. L-07 TaxID=1653480 RepID=UPI0006B462CE|nr:DNA cytosine methyltransferase [Alloactinosynnema sp. L-07]